MRHTEPYRTRTAVKVKQCPLLIFPRTLCRKTVKQLRAATVDLIKGGGRYFDAQTAKYIFNAVLAPQRNKSVAENNICIFLVYVKKYAVYVRKTCCQHRTQLVCIGQAVTIYDKAHHYLPRRLGAAQIYMTDQSFSAYFVVSINALFIAKSANNIGYVRKNPRLQHTVTATDYIVSF